MIEVQNLTIKNNDSELISNLDINFKKGEFWAILGKNGTGKTTLLHSLSGLLKYDSGNIKISGNNLDSLNSLDRAQKIALLSQLMETGLDCTVEQSIAYGRYSWNKFKFTEEQEKNRIDSALNVMQIMDIKNKSIQEISGGELRKVEIATILAQDSSILLLDEPLNHLDLSFRYALMNQLKKLSTKKIIIMVTHDIQYVKAYCTNVLFLLKDGNTAHGTTKEMMNKDNINNMLEINLPDNIFI